MPRVELLPVTYDPDRLLMWADENFRRITDAISALASSAASGGGGLSVPAANVISGTFGANVGSGDYTFPGNVTVTTALTVTGAINANGNTIVFASADSDNKIVLRSDAKIGTRSGDDMYFYSGGGNYSFEAPGGQWAFRYGPSEVNGAERGMWHSGNDQAAERYATGWFRQLASGQGYYHQVHGSGWYMIDGYFRIYQDHELYTNNKLRGQIARMGDGIWGDHATFGHNNYGPASDFCGMLQRWDSFVSMRTNAWFEIYVSGLLCTTYKNVGGLTEVKFFSMPALGGNTMIYATGSGQMGFASSTGRIKNHVRDLPESDHTNPLFQLKPRRFGWLEDKVVNAKEYNDRCPEGFAGLIAEEVASVMPDAVHLDGTGNPIGWDERTMMGYVVAAIQHLNRRLDKMEKKP